MKRESQKPDFKEKVSHYMDAGFPILYVNTFEEGKVGDIIYDVRGGRDVYEWNETNGYIHFETKTPENGGEDWALEDVLEFVKDPEILNQKILILKDTASYLEDPRIVSKLKGIARMIHQGIDATVIIISSVLLIPRELEKFITILDMDYLSEKEIKEIIQDFIQENDVEKVEEELIDRFAVAFKGLTEYEIENLLALSYSENGELEEDA